MLCSCFIYNALLYSPYACYIKDSNRTVVIFRNFNRDGGPWLPPLMTVFPMAHNSAKKFSHEKDKYSPLKFASGSAPSSRCNLITWLWRSCNHTHTFKVADMTI